MKRDLGLPAQVHACLFDLDGVITQTAKVHAQAWKQTFDEFRIPFDIVPDYTAYVDGKPRADGVRSVLTARGIEATPELVDGIASKKDQLFVDLIHRHGVQTYDGSVRYVRAARSSGLKIAVVSSSKHTAEVLRAAALDGEQPHQDHAGQRHGEPRELRLRNTQAFHRAEHGDGRRDEAVAEQQRRAEHAEDDEEVATPPVVAAMLPLEHEG